MVWLSPPKLDLGRVDCVIQFILASAAVADDHRDRELGPIHFVKYLYIADLAFAEKHNGETLTGVAWHFHHFGPWNAEVFERIEPVVMAVGAERKQIRSKYKDDVIRFRLDREDAERLLARCESQLPLEVQFRVSQAVREYGSDTASLLHHVYQTTPMLNAAPGETLDFPSVAREHRDEFAATETLVHSKTDRKARRRKIESIRQEVQSRLNKRQVGSTRLSLQPRYDDVFVAGTEWLDRLGGDAVESKTGDLSVDEDVWKSDSRRGPDLP